MRVAKKSLQIPNKNWGKCLPFTEQEGQTDQAAMSEIQSRRSQAKLSAPRGTGGSATRDPFGDYVPDATIQPQLTAATCFARTGWNLSSRLRHQWPIHDGTAPDPRRALGTSFGTSRSDETTARVLHRLAPGNHPTEAPHGTHCEPIRIRPSTPAHPNPKGGRSHAM